MNSLFAASRDQSRALDAAAAGCGVPSAMLMAAAGLQTARLAAHLMTEGSVPRGRVAVLSGRGNNGGDGLVAARHLAMWGSLVRCVLLPTPGDDPGALPDLARAAASAGVEVRQIAYGDSSVQARADWALDDVDLILDGLLGTGAAGAPRGDVATLIRRINRCSAAVLAVDLPSGLDADSGLAEGDCVRADHTVMLGAPRLGCEQLGARHWVGRRWLADIGIPRDAYRRCGLEPPVGLGPDPT